MGPAGHTKTETRPVIPTSPPLPVGCTPRVLCVDDNPDQADSEALFLRALGFEARACYGGRDALVLAGAFLPDVCLLDVSMPGMEGDELAARLRAWAGGRALVLVAVTAACNDTPAAGFDRHLLKPVDPSRLLAVVNVLTNGRPAENGRSLTTDAANFASASTSSPDPHCSAAKSNGSI